jgi:hypothetical protein
MVDRDSMSRAEYRAIVRRRMLVYALVVSLIGLPVGLLLELPYVWGLSCVGIVVAGIRLCWPCHPSGGRH